MSRYVLGVTGASGIIYATRTAMHLHRCGHDVTLIVTHPGKQVLEYEGQNALYDYCKDVCNVDDFFAECASGSSDIAGMAVVPCSMGTLGRIAAGTSDNLLVRAADVCLKERRPLVIVPREMPYNLIHIENMKRVTLAGAVVIPASPQFYSKPTTMEELVDTVVAKVLKHLGVEQSLVASVAKVWSGEERRFPLPGTSPGQAPAGMTTNDH
ncbi:UbiX family flavin prenyltransferase [Fibrobacter sp. UWB12]|uniref:UbiX family flavin prenyltransferase n=1 Tax=Fibrobacter sp. UWB12 TaxID=1896203 RepID=UPI0009110229|nr:UbiX family flavin prenyltransferase [Fibrobacter sp. UWB12]SHK74787.1 4-hydroxy-3-polyprenylbenzoate decarboxylase [Fibrobacter sp. UWB12]